MRPIIPLLLSILFVVSACAPPVPDAVIVRVQGVAPSNSECQIQLFRMDHEPYQHWKRPVNGPFEEIFYLPIPGLPYYVEGSCGMIVSFMKDVTFPRDTPLNVGTLRP